MSIAYLKGMKKRMLFTFCLLLLLLFLFGLSISVGSAKISFLDVYKVLLSRISTLFKANVDETCEYIILNLRLPRVLGAVVVGSALAVAGAVCQAIMRNPLASPFTIGVSSAASFGASLAIILGYGVLSCYGGGYGYIVTNELLVIVNSFVFCMLCAFIVSVVAGVKGSNPTTIVLCGVAVGYFFSACASIMQYLGEAEALKSVVAWLLGDLGRVTWRYLPWMSLSLMVIPLTPS